MEVADEMTGFGPHLMMDGYGCDKKKLQDLKDASLTSLLHDDAAAWQAKAKHSYTATHGFIKEIRPDDVVPLLIAAGAGYLMLLWPGIIFVNQLERRRRPIGNIPPRDPRRILRWR